MNTTNRMSIETIKEFSPGDAVRMRHAMFHDEPPMRVIDVTARPTTTYTHRDGSVTQWFGYRVASGAWLSGADLIRA